jgi:hypothetical protein
MSESGVKMKIKISYFLLLLVSICGTCATAAISNKNETCKLNSLTVLEHRLSTQFVFDFVKLPSCTVKALAARNLFELEFEGITRDDFSADEVIEKISKLSLVGGVSIFDGLESRENSKRSGVTLSIKIDPKKASLRVNSYKDLNQVVLDIFSKKKLSELAAKSSFLEVASISPSSIFPESLPTASASTIQTFSERDFFMKDARGSDRVLLMHNSVCGNSAVSSFICETKSALRREGLSPLFVNHDFKAESANCLKFAREVGARLLVSFDEEMRGGVSTVFRCDDLTIEPKRLSFEVGKSCLTAFRVARAAKELSLVELDFMNFEAQVVEQSGQSLGSFFIDRMVSI